MQLYELPAAHAALIQRIEDNEGEIDPLTETALKTLGDTLANCVEGICKAIMNEEGNADMFKAEAGRLLDAGRAAANRVERLKKYLKENMRLLGIDRIVAGTFKVSVQRNSRPSIYAEDVFSIPTDYVISTLSADNQKAYLTWKSTGSVPAGFSCDLGWHLRIR